MFTIESNDRETRARTGTMHLPHGPVETPVFMPVGTNGTVKAIYHSTIEKMGFKLILGNTYHLYLRPVTELISRYGGLHRFSNWKHNILTDSGGFQVFSLAPFRKISEEGVRFRSHIDGAYHTLTPEKVFEVQQILRSDIVMPLDVCTPPEITYKEALDALEMTTRWARRSVDRWQKREEDYDGKLFAIVQGNFYKDLRKRSAEELIALDTPGIAIGGLSVGEEYPVYQEFLASTAEHLPLEKPRYLMGIGNPEYILDAVENGIDLFDCVLPTRIARNGGAFTPEGIVHLKKAPHEFDQGPIQEGCPCEACRHYSRAYLRHLIKTREMLGPMLITEHNLLFLYNFVEDIKSAIRKGEFAAFKKDFLSRYISSSRIRGDHA